MPNKTLILGGYGNFGRRIAASLTKSGYQVIINGRDEKKAQEFAKKLNCEYSVFDSEIELDKKLKELSPKVVINTCGPFQGKDYSVAETCIENSVNYIDLADGRDFVTGITKLDNKAKERNVLVVSGASTVPGLSSAVIEYFKNEFSEFDSLKFGISPGQKASRGLATTKAILGYAGKKLKPCAGFPERYGWQDNYIQHYPELGGRLMANCEVPDLDLLPEKYGFKSIQFSAGMELWFVHYGIWLLGWLIRFGLPIKLEKYAFTLLKLSNFFDFIGSPDGGMHMIIKGKDTQGKEIERKWFIIAKNGDGPQIPTIPSIILAKKLIDNKLDLKGAITCVSLVSLEEYLDELKDFEVRVFN